MGGENALVDSQLERNALFNSHFKETKAVV